jgi:signal transduction histidine kinase
MKFTIKELRPLAILEDLPEQQLAWLSDHGTRIELATRDHMFTSGQPADFMFIVVAGTIQRYQEIDGQWLVAAITSRGQVTGMLPYSRMTHYPGHAIAAVPSLVLRIDKKDFNEMLVVSHEFGQRLVAEMSNRVRGDVRLEQQREKLVSLGRLSSGLAHELNNPAAAISRTAASLTDRLADHRTFIMTLARHEMNETIIDAIEQLLRIVQERDFSNSSPLQLSANEEEITDWLEERAVANSWKLANVFTVTGLCINDLERFSETVPQAYLGDALTWVAANIEIDQMLNEIKFSAGRVSELISSVKNYSHMDQSFEHKPTDVHDGLESTLKMFGYRFKQKNIRLKRNYRQDLQVIPGNAGELNQVWTYLIENAIDAMAENGELCIEIESNDLSVDVKIIDNGQGIPEDIRHRIFDPFFTTKGVGKGTGLGLDIAQRIVQTHRGQIDVRSRPGRTEISVRLPIAPIEM